MMRKFHVQSNISKKVSMLYVMFCKSLMPLAASHCFRTEKRLLRLTSQKNVLGEVQNLKRTLVFQNTIRFLIT